MADLTTAAAVESYLNLSSDEGGATLDSIVSAVSEAIQRAMGRRIPQATYTDEKHSGDGFHAYVIPENAPVQSVDSVVLDGTTLAATDYELEDAPGRWPVLYYTPGGASTPSPWPRGLRNVVLTYDGGYSSVPAEIAQAAIEQSAYVYEGKQRIGHRSKTIGGDVSETYLVDAFLPSVQAVIELYRRPHGT